MNLSSFKSEEIKARHREACRRYRLKNKIKIAEYNSQYRQNNKGRFSAYMSQWRRTKNGRESTKEKRALKLALSGKI